MRTDSMDAEDYSFFLAYGMTQEDEEFNSLTEALSIGYTETDPGTMRLGEGTDPFRFEEAC
tara:strand:- start:386 stop:568 length:183 start_codon:yes stop_codon:yes gene_type:complete